MTDDDANEPLPPPPAELLDFLRRVEEAGDEVPKDLRVKARISRESLETRAATRVTVDDAGNLVYQVHVADAATATDTVQVMQAVEAVADKVPPRVRTFLQGLAAGVGTEVLAGMIVDVIQRAPEWIAGLF